MDGMTSYSIMYIFKYRKYILYREKFTYIIHSYRNKLVMFWINVLSFRCTTYDRFLLNMTDIVLCM